MLSVYLTRAFTLDIAEHLAKAKNPDAPRIAPGLRRRIGVGNSTGLGMAPFLIKHPILIDHWVRVREEALARVRAVAEAKQREKETFAEYLACAKLQASRWNTNHPLYVPRVVALREDLNKLETHVAAGALHGPDPWDRLYRWAADALTADGREMVVSMMMEPYGHLVDGLADCMAADEDTYGRLDGRMTCGHLRSMVGRIYEFAVETDFSESRAQARCWYVSEEKLEPRLGERFEEPIADYEQPLAPARDAKALYQALASRPTGDPVAAFLMERPEHRSAALRAQIAGRFPFAEIRDNTIAAEMLPIDLLRCKLSFFGATKFDPRSDRWVRINMFQGAPLPDEMPCPEADLWAWSG